MKRFEIWYMSEGQKYVLWSYDRQLLSSLLEGFQKNGVASGWEGTER